MSLSLPALINQLRASYPAASLLSELLVFESNTFVVRALIQMGSLTLATGIAAAADVEAAEDRAKCRAIESLLPSAAAVPTPAPAISASGEPGTASLSDQATFAPRTSPPAVPPLSPLTKSAPNPVASQFPEGVIAPAGKTEPQPKTGLPPTALPPTDPASAEALTDWDNPLRSSPASPNLDLDFDLNDLLQDTASEPAAEAAPPAAADLFAAVTSDATTPIDPPVNLADLNLTKLTLPQTSPAETGTPSASEKPSRRKSAASTAAPAEPVTVSPVTVPPTLPPVEIDRSEEIARIGVEMKRLGWDTKKGRDHLQKTYGKRSRQELNDDELMDFLRYLEAQPSSAQMPF